MARQSLDRIKPINQFLFVQLYSTTQKIHKLGKFNHGLVYNFINYCSARLQFGDWFVVTYAVVVMPGLSKLSDKEFLRAFQTTDRVIQNKHPLFMIIWLGSIISVSGTMISSIANFGPLDSLFVILAGSLYFLGVQGLTIIIHLPLNKRIQAIDIENLTSQELNEERSKFERKWNFLITFVQLFLFL